MLSKPRSGMLIDRRYRLERELARGGMGSVWVADDERLRRSVAVKVMMASWTMSSEARTRFEREAMAVAQLQSPYVVQIFDYGIEKGCPFIVMELLHGEDLRTRLRRRKRLSLDATAQILVQTAKALSVAHAAGVVHRDLKPGNIFLAKSRDEELVKVLDFGVAKVDAAMSLLDEATTEGTVLGTPQFMSPEQARSLPHVDHRADLWSLGVIAFRSLTGRLPFEGKSAGDVIVKICTHKLPKATAFAPDLPPEIERFFQRALSRKVTLRFQSAKELAIAFGRIAPASFPSLSMPEPQADISAMIGGALSGTPEDLDWDESFDEEETAVSTSSPDVLEEPGGPPASIPNPTEGRRSFPFAPPSAPEPPEFGPPPSRPGIPLAGNSEPPTVLPISQAGLTPHPASGAPHSSSDPLAISQPGLASATPPPQALDGVPLSGIPDSSGNLPRKSRYRRLVYWGAGATLIAAIGYIIGAVVNVGQADVTARAASPGSATLGTEQADAPTEPTAGHAAAPIDTATSSQTVSATDSAQNQPETDASAAPSSDPSATDRARSFANQRPNQTTKPRHSTPSSKASPPAKGTETGKKDPPSTPPEPEDPLSERL